MQPITMNRIGGSKSAISYKLTQVWTGQKPVLPMKPVTLISGQPEEGTRESLSFILGLTARHTMRLLCWIKAFTSVALNKITINFLYFYLYYI
jgi:hypothetical protein